MKSELFYIHDPMCSWCWGFEGVAKPFFNRLPENINVHRLLGGLAEDSDQPMLLAMQRSIQDTWLRIENNIPGISFNFDFWQKCHPRRSTYPACRAVIAARLQGDEYDVKMTARIQQAYYREAKNPSDISTLVDLAIDIGLDSQQFSRDLIADTTQQKLMKEIQLSRDLHVDSFPAIVFKLGESVWPIAIDYLDAAPMLELIEILKEGET